MRSSKFLRCVPTSSGLLLLTHLREQLVSKSEQRRGIRKVFTMKQVRISEQCLCGEYRQSGLWFLCPSSTRLPGMKCELVKNSLHTLQSHNFVRFWYFTTNKDTENFYGMHTYFRSFCLMRKETMAYQYNMTVDGNYKFVFLCAVEVLRMYHKSMTEKYWVMIAIW